MPQFPSTSARQPQPHWSISSPRHHTSRSSLQQRNHTSRSGQLASAHRLIVTACADAFRLFSHCHRRAVFIPLPHVCPRDNVPQQISKLRGDQKKTFSALRDSHFLGGELSSKTQLIGWNNRKDHGLVLRNQIRDFSTLFLSVLTGTSSHFVLRIKPLALLHPNLHLQVEDDWYYIDLGERVWNLLKRVFHQDHHWKLSLLIIFDMDSPLVLQGQQSQR